MRPTIERVLVATDFSAPGQLAIAAAAEWAQQARAQLRIVHVTPPKGWLRSAWGLKSAVADSIEQHATSALRQVVEKAVPRAIETSTGVLSGAAARSIVRAARDYRADLLVVGARGERDAQGEQALGGTSARLLATAQIPLLLVRRSHKDPAARVVAAVDLSPQSRAVLDWADLAAAERHLHAYHVYDVPFVERLEAYGLAPSAIDVYSTQAGSQCDAKLADLVASIGRTGATTRKVERGEPAVMLRRYIESVRPSLVVVGKHGSGGSRLSPYVAASVSADVLVV